MTTLSTQDGKRLLRKLESQVHKGMEGFYQAGQALKEIRDYERYKADGFETWKQYCKERWEYDENYAGKLIRASEYRENLPTGTTGTSQWSERSVRELTRIPTKKQAARVAADIVKAVEESEKAAAQNPDAKPLKLSSATVRKYVDEVLGIDRAAKARATKDEHKERGVDFDMHLYDVARRVEGFLEFFAEVPGDAWELLADKSPSVVSQFVLRCEELARVAETIKHRCKPIEVFSFELARQRDIQAKAETLKLEQQAGA